VRRGAAWPPASDRAADCRGSSRPVLARGAPVVLVRWAVRGCCSPTRRLPGGASSRHPASGVVAVVDNPRTPAVASSPVRVHHAASTHPVRRPGSGCPAVRCPARPVSGHPGSSSRGPAVRTDGVHPSGVQPPGVHPVRPDASVPSTSGGGVGDQAGAAGHPAPRARVEVAVGGRDVEQPGRRPREAWTQTTLPRPRVGQRGRRRTRTGLC
jgi:hypothetical protein